MKKIFYLMLLVLFINVNVFAQEYKFTNGDYIEFSIQSSGVRTISIKLMKSETWEAVLIMYIPELNVYTLSMIDPNISKEEGFKNMKVIEKVDVEEIITSALELINKIHSDIDVQEYEGLFEKFYHERE